MPLTIMSPVAVTVIFKKAPSYARAEQAKSNSDGKAISQTTGIHVHTSNIELTTATGITADGEASL